MQIAQYDRVVAVTIERDHDFGEAYNVVAEAISSGKRINIFRSASTAREFRATVFPDLTVKARFDSRRPAATATAALNAAIDAARPPMDGTE